MSDQWTGIRVGTPPDRLDVTRKTVDRLHAVLPSVQFVVVASSMPGDHETRADSSETPGDALRADLGASLEAGDIDCSIHSARDLPEGDRAGLDWFWLPWREDRDEVDVQALTFRAGDERFRRLRGLFIKAVYFVGAGAGRADTCTLAGIQAMRQADVCLYDSLLDPRLLEFLRPEAQSVYVGKRCGKPSLPQEAITALIADYTRRGDRVVRLKGGDPGIFGRLAEEVEALEALGLPFRVIPGVGSLNEATTGTGMLLTRRGLSRGFSVVTPRLRGGSRGPVDASARAELPVVMFMAVHAAEEVVADLMGEGMPGDTPSALVFSAGTDFERVIKAPLSEIPAEATGMRAGHYGRNEDGEGGFGPGLLIVGNVTRFHYSAKTGALRGKRVLLTCSEALQERAGRLCRDLGGVPLQLPLVRLVTEPSAAEAIRNVAAYDWVVLTSPAAVRAFVEVLRDVQADVRRLPRLMVSGEGTARELLALPVAADLVPESDFGGDAMLEAAAAQLNGGERVLRLRSDRAGTKMADALRSLGARVDDVVLYRNESAARGVLPDYDAVFFASGSAVDAFAAAWGLDAGAMRDKYVIAIGGPTTAALARYNVVPNQVGPEATVESCLLAYAEGEVLRAFLAPGR